MDYNNSILSIKGLKTNFKLKGGKSFCAVDGIDLNINSGEIHGLVGESGCGKTMTSLSIMQLVERPGVISGGKVLWNGEDILAQNNNHMRKIRGREIAMIFQNPQAALNPLYTIGEQLKTVIMLHKKITKKQAMDEALELLNMVKIPDPQRRIRDYPHNLSGGQCQRVMIAMALSCRPKLLLADEPTAALDVTIQAQILDLLLELREKFNMAILLISHDMGVVANMCERISVMYLGKIIESAMTEDLYFSPKHPYTQALLNSVPVPRPGFKGKKRFSAITGDVSNSSEIPEGCRFRTRCPRAFEKCSVEPELKSANEKDTKVACWLYDE